MTSVRVLCDNAGVFENIISTFGSNVKINKEAPYDLTIIYVSASLQGYDESDLTHTRLYTTLG